ncbi:hypothetical protein [Lacrimispora sp. 38-1]|uniref:hypothetical protein n=1 Tax=Lacrimispora sp. 38-1 TaxID=3125778 RepID=UPI003CF7DD5C
MNKKIIHIFISTCLMLTMSTTTVFAATTEIAGTSTAMSTNLSSNIKSKTFYHNIYKDGELILKIKSNVSGFSDGSYTKFYITDVSVDLSGPMANKCHEKTTYTCPVAVTSITTVDSDLIAVMGFSITNKGKITCDFKKFVK